MRIRSIHPNFWRSDDIAALPRDLRLLFIGLWSYVDDNGVGRDDYRHITADLFAAEDDPVGTRQFVREGLARLSAQSLVVRYEHDGKRFIFIPSWDKWQRVDRPSKPRYPRPDECGATILTSANADPESETTAGLARASRQARESPSTGEGEKGRRGVPPTAGAPARRDGPDADSTDLTAQTLIAEWIDHCRRRPPGNVIGQVAKQCKGLLDEGFDYDDVRAGLALWHSRGLHPSTLPSVVNEHVNATPNVSRRQAETDAQFERAMARAREREAQQ